MMPKWTKRSPEFVAKVRACAERGMSAKDAAAELGVSLPVVTNIARTREFSFNSNVVWTPDRLRQAVEAAAAGISRKEAARLFGVSFNAIRRLSFVYGVRFHGRPWQDRKRAAEGQGAAA